MNFPWVHTAGDTLDFEVDIPDYPSTDGWTLEYYLTARFSTPVQAQIVLTATGNADGTYQVQESPANTALWAAGTYGWHRLVTKAGARQTLTSSDDQGEMQVRANPVGAVQGTDTRSHVRKMLEAIEAVIESRASSTQREMVAYTIGTRSQEFDKDESKAALIELHSKYKWLVANEDARARVASGLSNPRDVRIRFGAS